MMKAFLNIIGSFSLMLSGCISTEKVFERTIYIGAETKPCMLGVMPAECMQVKWQKSQDSWENFPQTTIENFGYEKGYEYELVVSEKKSDIPNGVQDAIGVEYRLVKQVSKTKI